MFIDYPFAMVNGPMRGPGGAMPDGALTNTAGGTGSSFNVQLKQVGRVRHIFPETWLWSNAVVGLVLSFSNL